MLDKKAFGSEGESLKLLWPQSHKVLRFKLYKIMAPFQNLNDLAQKQRVGLNWDSRRYLGYRESS